MREFIRHPSDIPITYELEDVGEAIDERLNNVSVGGLCFQSVSEIETARGILLSFPSLKPAVRVRGVVVWCAKNGDHFDVGVKFHDRSVEYRVRMVEQICHIEHYRKEVLRTHGRKLLSTEAASEWIERYAHAFPQMTE